MGALDQAVAVIFFLAAATWVGGLVAVIIVVRSAHVSLAPPQRVRFFRALGRRYLTVLGTSFVLAVATGGWVLRANPWDAAMAALVLSIAALALSTVAGIVQARAMTRLRRRATGSPDDPQLADRVATVARRAIILRAVLTVLTLASVVLAVMVTTG
ncbi:hypothetical protein [Georgenia subflava]|uniref:DUF2269 family protein n=1 Tax=Georgenia subflava TaxID=1622177 RepID=A0A6N7EFN1_9MICO|nr:hypothetical protein [Georgenia subflava]MPV35993.1 hypothetical protein [Georgenia subflava]